MNPLVKKLVLVLAAVMLGAMMMAGCKNEGKNPEETTSMSGYLKLGEIKELGKGITPAVAVDSEGNPHVVYGANNRMMYMKGDPSGLFGSPEEIPLPDDGPGMYSFPEIVLDKNSDPHIVFQMDEAGRSKKGWYTNRVGDSWKTLLMFIHNPGNSKNNRVNNPRIVIYDDIAVIGTYGSPGNGNNQSSITKLSDIFTSPKVEKVEYTELEVATPIIDSNGKLFISGRKGSLGHFTQEFTLAFEKVGGLEKISLSERDGVIRRTTEPFGSVMGSNDVIHFTGVIYSDEENQDQIWYNNTDRLKNEQYMYTGLGMNGLVSEHVYPTIAEAEQGRIYITYHDYHDQSGKVALAEKDDFFNPVSFTSPENRPTDKLRYNPHLAPAKGGGIYVVWESHDENIYFRSIGVKKG